MGERLDCHWYERDDRKVAAALAAGEEVDAVHPLDAGALLDGYWHYLDRLGVLALMGDVSVSACRRKALPVFDLTALYHLKTLMGIESINSLPALLFSDPVAMSVLGGNAELVCNGLTQRSQDRRTVSAGKPRTMDADVLGNYAACWSAHEAAQFFNDVVASLARAGAYGRWVRAVMDGSHLHTTADFTFETPGWSGLKLLLWWDAFSGLPLAAKVTHKDVYEPAHVMDLYEQALANLGGHSRIGEFVADRLYVDGKVLYALDGEDIVFSVVAKEKMQIRDEALSLAMAGSGHRQERGGKKDAVTEVVGVEFLTTYDDFNDPELARYKNRKDYLPPTLNAAVVLRSERLFPKQGHLPWVILTNGSVKRPFETYDRYDDRSLIENLAFREGKQGWNLERPPQRNERAYVTHVFLTLAVYALATAYRAQCEAEDRAAAEAARRTAKAAAKKEEATEHHRPKEAIRHYRQRVAQENRAKVWVRVGNVYGILHLAEMSILLGMRLRNVPREVGTREQVYRRYGLDPPA